MIKLDIKSTEFAPHNGLVVIRLDEIKRDSGIVVKDATRDGLCVGTIISKSNVGISSGSKKKLVNDFYNVGDRVIIDAKQIAMIKFTDMECAICTNEKINGVLV